MKLISKKIAQDDVVLDEDFNGTLIIQSGDAFFLVREYVPKTLVILCPENDPGETVYRMLIEPVSGHSFQITEWVIKPDEAG
jgi:hypothetical protein